MGSREFSRWMAYAQRYPFSGRRIDVGFARVCAVIANVKRGKNVKPFSIEDFMPSFGEPESEMTAEERAEKLDTVFGSLFDAPPRVVQLRKRERDG